MSQNLSDFFTEFPFSRSEGIESILTLLNLISDPAIIYDREQDHILAANNAFYLLTTLEESEFIGKDIHSILPNITDTHPTTGHGQISRLRHKRQPSMPVEIRLFSLAKSSDAILMLFHPEGLTLEMHVSESDHHELIKKFHTLIQSRLRENIKSALNQVLTTARDLLSADLVCIYKASSAAPQLVQYLASDEALAASLPEILTSEDLAIGQEPTLWTADDLALSPASKISFQRRLSIPGGRAPGPAKR